MLSRSLRISGSRLASVRTPDGLLDPSRRGQRGQHLDEPVDGVDPGHGHPGYFHRAGGFPFRGCGGSSPARWGRTRRGRWLAARPARALRAAPWPASRRRRSYRFIAGGERIPAGRFRAESAPRSEAWWRWSLPEVGGDAMAYCGIDADDIAAGLVELLDDPTRRAELSAAAQRRAKDFSWATSATLHREAYSHAVAARRRSR